MARTSRTLWPLALGAALACASTANAHEASLSVGVAAWDAVTDAAGRETDDTLVPLVLRGAVDIVSRLEGWAELSLVRRVVEPEGADATSVFGTRELVAGVGYTLGLAEGQLGVQGAFKLDLGADDALVRVSDGQHGVHFDVRYTQPLAPRLPVTISAGVVHAFKDGDTGLRNGLLFQFAAGASYLLTDSLRAGLTVGYASRAEVEVDGVAAPGTDWTVVHVIPSLGFTVNESLAISLSGGTRLEDFTVGLPVRTDGFPSLLGGELSVVWRF